MYVKYQRQLQSGLATEICRFSLFSQCFCISYLSVYNLSFFLRIFVFGHIFTWVLSLLYDFIVLYIPASASDARFCEYEGQAVAMTFCCGRYFSMPDACEVSK